MRKKSGGHVASALAAMLANRAFAGRDCPGPEGPLWINGFRRFGRIRLNQGSRRAVASETSQTAGLAGRYATALYDLAHDSAALDQVSADLAQLKALIAESPDARHLIASPLIPRAQQAKAMAALVARAGLGSLARQFVGVVANNRRLARLPEFIDSFESLLARRRGDVEVEVVSAVPLSTAQIAAIEKAVPGATGRKVRLVPRIDPKLIGGLRVKFGSRLVDASIAAKLSRLQLAMKGTA